MIGTDAWRQHARPTRIADDLVVVPAWLPFEQRHGETVIRIEPAAAFGLGDHPTTRLSAAALQGAMHEFAVRRPERPPCVLDVGCGTGILSVIAARLGAARVRAIDVSVDALEASAANARANNAHDIIEIDDTPIAEIDELFDAVVANILAPALVSMAADLQRLTSSDGLLIISGVLAGAYAHVVEALSPMVAIRTATLDGWAAVTFRHG